MDATSLQVNFMKRDNTTGKFATKEQTRNATPVHSHLGIKQNLRNTTLHPSSRSTKSFAVLKTVHRGSIGHSI